MSRRPGHRKFNVTREVISKGTDGKEHFCKGGCRRAEQTIDAGRPLIGSAVTMEWLKEPERRGRGGVWGGTCRPLARSSVLSRLLHVCPLHQPSDCFPSDVTQRSKGQRGSAQCEAGSFDTYFLGGVGRIFDCFVSRQDSCDTLQGRLTLVAAAAWISAVQLSARCVNSSRSSVPPVCEVTSVPPASPRLGGPVPVKACVVWAPSDPPCSAMQIRAF